MAKRPVDPVAWATAVDSEQLLLLYFPDGRSYRSTRVQRRVRLAICGYLRQCWPKLTDARCCEAVETAERFADGYALVRELAVARKSVGNAYHVFGSLLIIVCDRKLTGWHSRMLGLDDESLAIVRDLFPDPSVPPVKVPKKWRTATVTAVARGCYDDRAFDRLPVLADALEDAGCDSEPLLTHLRGPGPHVRGCWALDVILGL